MRAVVAALGIFGGMLAGGNGVWAFLEVGANPEYADRLWAWAIAMVAALDPIVLPLVLARRQLLVGLLLIVSAVAGAFFMNLYYVNTFYMLGSLFMLIAGALAFVGYLTGDRG